MTGRLTVVDQNGLRIQNAIPSALLVFRGTSGSAGTALQPDGTFRIPLAEGDQVISFSRLPPQYIVVAITSGPEDLMKSPLRIDKNGPPAEIQVQLQLRP